MEKFEQIYSDYSQDKISLQDFQFRLESMLGSYEFLSKRDGEFIKNTINNLELIVYTIPEELQKPKVAKMCSEIISYFQMKEV